MIPNPVIRITKFFSKNGLNFAEILARHGVNLLSPCLDTAKSKCLQDVFSILKGQFHGEKNIADFLVSMTPTCQVSQCH